MQKRVIIMDPACMAKPIRSMAMGFQYISYPWATDPPLPPFATTGRPTQHTPACCEGNPVSSFYLRPSSKHTWGFSTVYEYRYPP